MLSKEYHDSCAQFVSVNKPYSSAYQISSNKEFPDPAPPEEQKKSNKHNKNKHVQGDISLCDIQAQFAEFKEFGQEHFDKAKDLFIKAFPSIFSDDLVGKPPIPCDPVKIHYEESSDTVPLNVQSARPIPKHWEKEADKKIRKLLKQE